MAINTGTFHVQCMPSWCYFTCPVTIYQVSPSGSTLVGVFDGTSVQYSTTMAGRSVVFLTATLDRWTRAFVNLLLNLASEPISQIFQNCPNFKKKLFCLIKSFCSVHQHRWNIKKLEGKLQGRWARARYLQKTNIERLPGDFVVLFHETNRDEAFK